MRKNFSWSPSLNFCANKKHGENKRTKKDIGNAFFIKMILMDSKLTKINTGSCYVNLNILLINPGRGALSDLTILRVGIVIDVNEVAVNFF